jgi:hypothetical protein
MQAFPPTFLKFYGERKNIAKLSAMLEKNLYGKLDKSLPGRYAMY